MTHHKVVQDKSVKWFCDKWVDAKATVGAHENAFGFLEIPFDGAVSYRPGTRFAPAKIVEILNGFSLYCADRRISLEEIIFTHFGKVEINNSFDETYKNIFSAVTNIPNFYIPICLGGDHSITDPIFRAIKNKNPRKKIGLVVFDAHFDSRELMSGKKHSGNWLYTLSDCIDYHDVVQVGINANIYSAAYMEQAEQNGILVRTAYEVRKKGVMQIIQEIVGHFGDAIDDLYISLDIDVCDQSFAPGTSVPNSSGLFPHEITDMIFALTQKYNVRCFDLVEVNPLVDLGDATSQVAAHIVFNFLAGTIKYGNKYETKCSGNC